MSVTYDGRLVLSSKAKTIDPCCPTMHSTVFSGLIYVGSCGKAPCIALRVGEKKGSKIEVCPFCGAKVEAVE